MYKRKLTQDDIKRIVSSIDKLAEIGNPIAKVLQGRIAGKVSNLQSQEIGSFYVWTYQVLTLLDMSLKSELSSEKFQEELDKLLKVEVKDGKAQQPKTDD